LANSEIRLGINCGENGSLCIGKKNCFSWIFMVDSVSQKAYFSLKHRIFALFSTTGKLVGALDKENTHFPLLPQKRGSKRHSEDRIPVSGMTT
jgi:hypothetical protein